MKTNEVAVITPQMLTTNLQEKIIDLANRSRRNNFRVDANETWQVCEMKIKERLKKKLKLKEDIKKTEQETEVKGSQERSFSNLSYKDMSLILGCAKSLSGTGMSMKIICR